MTDSVVINSTPKGPSLEETAKEMGIDANALDESAEGQSAPERPGWLPEKFKSPEDMANAYSELEKKLGSPKEEAPSTDDVSDEEAPKDEDKQEQTTEDQAREAVENAGLNFDELSAKYWEKGSIEEADYAKLEKAGIPRHMVDQFAEGQKAVVALERQEAVNLVGGEDSYTEMVQWASRTLTDKEVEIYDKAVNGNDKNARHMAIKGLEARFKSSAGYEPSRTVGGQGGKGGQEVYGSIAELQEDMRDPRYKKDSAFIRKVEAKLARSNIF